MPRLILLLLVPLAIGCDSGRLTAEAAAEAFRTEINDPDVKVEIKGIAQADGAIEAIVDASLPDPFGNTQMGFRRYDTGWKWETATVHGGPTSPATTAIEAFRAVARMRRATTWAEPLIEKYQLTAELLNALAGNVSRLPSDDLSDATWKARYDLALSILRSVPPPNPERTKRLLPLFDPPVDAWGTPVKWALHNDTRNASIESAGPDLVMGTTDDLICELHGRLAWDSSYGERLWNYPRAWRLPEGLARALTNYLPPNSMDNTVTYVAHIK